MSFSRITKRDNPVTIAKRGKQYEELLTKALSIAVQYAKREPRDVREILASASVQGIVSNYKVASIAYPNPKDKSTWSSNMSWESLKDGTVDELARHMILSARHNLQASKKGLYGNGPPRSMRFEERELAPHPKSIDHKVLEEGGVYFIISFLDDEYLVPELDAVVFIGRNLRRGDRGKIYFQDFASYDEGVRFPADRGSAAEFICFVATEHCVYEFEQVLNQLLRCSIKRSTRGVTSRRRDIGYAFHIHIQLGGTGPYCYRCFRWRHFLQLQCIHR